MALNPPDSWSYYKQIDIADVGGISADYQMKLTIYSGYGDDNTATGKIYCNNHCKDFPDDIRFGTTDNPYTATELYQWIESSDATEAVIWVKMVAANTIYLFIGRSDTDELSDGANTFVAWDDFDENYSVNDVPKAARGWTTAGVDANNYFKIAANPSGSGNVLKCVESGDGTLTKLKLLNFAGAGEYAIHYKTYAINHAGHYFYEEGREGGEAGTYCTWAGINLGFNDGRVNWYGPPAAPGIKEFAPELDMDINSWEDSELRITATTYHYVLDGTDGTGDFFFDPTVGIDTTVFYHNENVAGTWYMSDFYIRKYSTSPPTWSAFGAWKKRPKKILHLDPGPHPRSKAGFIPTFTGMWG